MPQPFEASPEEVLADLDVYVDEVFSTLESQFLTLPRGDGFLDYDLFELGYQALHDATDGFRDVSAPPIVEAVYRVPVALIVLRSILGFTPPEWAHVASSQLGLDVPQGAVRTLDRSIRLAPTLPIDAPSAALATRVRSLIEVACQLLQSGCPPTPPQILHRLDKSDTRRGAETLRRLAADGVPYPELLYERFLGRPFAAHRDSVSELVGDVLEAAIEEVLADGEVPYHKTVRAERIEGFDQAPDFLIPDGATPSVVIEAKITEDDGTARDKVTRVQHLRAISDRRQERGMPPFEVVACIAGRGFGVRREDMRKLLTATGGKVFTLSQVGRLIHHTGVSAFIRSSS